VGGSRARAVLLGGGGDLERFSRRDVRPDLTTVRDPADLRGGDLERAGGSVDGDLVPLELGGVLDPIGLRETDRERWRCRRGSVVDFLDLDGGL
jgi:hypothetical protein